jgi:hypothetical protein
VKVEFSPLPGESSLRPVVQLRLAAASGARIPVLVDSGAASVRLPGVWAAAIGLDASMGRSTWVTIGGSQRLGNELEVELTLGRWTWTAPVTFLQRWEFGHGVVGLRGFFDQFKIQFDAARDLMTILPARYRP